MATQLTADVALNANVTWISNFTDCVEPRPAAPYDAWEYALYGSLMVFLTCGTVLGNILVLLTITMVKKLRQQPANLLLLSLCISDQMIALTVELFAMYKTLNSGVWGAGDELCRVYLFLDVMCCTASILNLSAITVDRYLVITRPFTYTLQRTRKLMGIMIASVWIIATVVSAGGFAWRKESALNDTRKCDYPEDLSYQIYATFMAFYGPLTIMLILWGRIFLVAHKMAQADKVQQVALRSQQQNAIPTETQLKELQKLHNNADDEDAENDDAENHLNGFGKKNSEQLVLSVEAKQRQSASVASSGGNAKRKPGENKALITVAVIMGCFTLCWLPFFVVMFVGPIYNFIKQNESLRCVNDAIFPVFKSHPAMSLLLWLGYVNSFMNPIIYAKFNRDFRRPFQRFLRCHCDVNARMRIDQYAEQYGAQGGKADINASLQYALRANHGEMTRKQAEDAGLLTQSTKRSKLPRGHVLESNNHISENNFNGGSHPI